jgi:hypothetical protein
MAQTIDEDWLAELRVNLEPHGSKIALARSLRVEPSQISKLWKGTHAPAHLVIEVSKHFGMMLPASWFDPREARVLRAIRQVESLLEAAPDAKRRAAGEQLLDAMTDDVEESARSLREHLSALIRESNRRKRFEDDGN